MKFPTIAALVITCLALTLSLLLGCQTPSQKQTQRSSQEQAQEQSQDSEQRQQTGTSTVPIIIICNQMNAGRADGASCMRPANTTGIADTIRATSEPQLEKKK